MSELYEAEDRPLPYPTAWAVNCPNCNQAFEYEPDEDDSGAFGFDPSNWPVCEECKVMFMPKTVCVIEFEEAAE